MARKPPVPRSLNLRRFSWMPLDLTELANSDTWAMAATVPGASRACINLWLRAWHQVPAASLPDNDKLLRRWADVPNWDVVKEIALRGFVKCSDGRLYHAVLARKAIKSGEQLRDRFRKLETDRQRKKDARAQKLRKKEAESKATSDGDPEDVQQISTGRPKNVRSKRGRRRERGEGEEEEATISQKELPRKRGPYVFSGKIVKLNKADFDKWRASFKHLNDLPALLTSRDEFLSALPPDDVGNWFVSTAAWLANRNEKAAAEKNSPRGPYM